MNELKTIHEQKASNKKIMNMLRMSHEQAVTSHEQIMDESWKENEKKRTCHKQVMNEL